MDTSRLLFLVFMVITTAECSETDEQQCENYDQQKYNLLEGEAFYFVPYNLLYKNLTDEEFTWYKNNSQIEKISTDDNEMVHYHGGALFFLKLLPENSGLYTARHTKPSGECDIYSVKVEVLKTKNDSALLYGEINNSDQNKKVTCPDPVSYTCETMKGEFTWYKDFVICEIDNEDDLWVYNATKDNEGIYTCICTWTHNHKVYNSSGSRRLTVKARTSPRPATPLQR